MSKKPKHSGNKRKDMKEIITLVAAMAELVTAILMLIKTLAS